MQPHHCVPLRGRADIIHSLLVEMCLLCLTKVEVWHFFGNMGNHLAVTDTVVGVLLNGFNHVLLSGAPHMPLL